ncbi:hypothetical protein ACOMHN_055823 [Nucella lapillus]
MTRGLTKGGTTGRLVTKATTDSAADSAHGHYYDGGLSMGPEVIYAHTPTLYSAKHLSFRLSVLNSDEEQVPDAARSSLALHMQKSKVSEATATDNAFCGFQTTDEATLPRLRGRGLTGRI